MEKYEAEIREDENSLFFLWLCVIAVKTVISEYHFFHAWSGSVCFWRVLPQPKKTVILELSSAAFDMHRGISMQTVFCFLKILEDFLFVTCLWFVSLRSESSDNLDVLSRKLQSIQDIDELTKMVSINRQTSSHMVTSTACLTFVRWHFVWLYEAPRRRRVRGEEDDPSSHPTNPRWTAARWVKPCVSIKYDTTGLVKMKSNCKKYS